VSSLLMITIADFAPMVAGSKTICRGAEVPTGAGVGLIITKSEALIPERLIELTFRGVSPVFSIVKVLGREPVAILTLPKSVPLVTLAEVVPL